jgi:hypothetical protein
MGGFGEGGGVSGFEGEQFSFERDAGVCGETAELSVSADDAVTGNDEGDGIYGHDGADGAGGGGMPGSGGELAVAGGGAVRDLSAGREDFALERGLGGQVDGEIEGFGMAVEVSPDLLLEVGEKGWAKFGTRPTAFDAAF